MQQQLEMRERCMGEAVGSESVRVCSFLKLATSCSYDADGLKHCKYTKHVEYKVYHSGYDDEQHV
jgi:hypothetical protein